MVTDEHRPDGSGGRDLRGAAGRGASRVQAEAPAKAPAKAVAHPSSDPHQRGAAKAGAKVRVSVSGGPGLADESQEQSKRMGTARKSAFFLLLVGIAYVLYLILSGQMDVFLSSLAEVDPYWVFAGMLAYVVYFILGVSAYVLALAKDTKSPLGIRDLMSVEATGMFFSNLTPNGAGGAPAQIYRITRAGLSLGRAGAVQYTRFVIYEAAEGIFAAIMLIFRLDYFFDTYGDVFLIGVLIFGFKILEVAAFVVVCLFPGVVKRVGRFVLRQANKTGRVKRYDYWNNLIETQVDEFATGFRTASKNVKEMLATLLVTLLQLGCLYSLPWFTLQAFGKQGDILTCVACGSMLELLTSAIPLPGGTGGAEGGFALLFGYMFGEARSAAYVVWRAIEYILPVLFAIPLMGLKTKSGKSVYKRLSALGLVEGQKATGRARSGASVDLKRLRDKDVR
ncbi:MAG: YbhN family protein [Olsenella sp.]|jgi:uncharacterized protein (TIRG00374 family)